MWGPGRLGGSAADDETTSAAPTDTSGRAHGGSGQPELQGVHGLRLRRIRRQGLQPDRAEGPDRRRRQFGIQTAQVESTGDDQYADNINQLIQQSCNEITTVGFLLGDATAGRRQEEPRRRLRDRRLRLREGSGQPQGPDLLDRPAVVPRRLPGRGHVGERCRRHLRWPADPDGDDLHGGLPPGRREVQRGQRHRRASCSAGTARTARSPRTSRTRPRASRSASS